MKTLDCCAPMPERQACSLIMLLLVLLLPGKTVLAASADAGKRMDRTEVSIGDFAAFVAATGFVTRAETEGGMVFEAGWQTKPGWNWRTPYGIPSPAEEPAVHITYDEASTYCRWRGKRLPTRDEWIEAGYTESRENPPSPFRKGVTYPYPTGETPSGANCLNDSATAAASCKTPAGKTDYAELLYRGAGHARTGLTKEGVNGLYEMAANVWEWASLDETAASPATMGGSWWYGARQMQADYGATKPRDMAAVYIGFRCIAE